MSLPGRVVPIEDVKDRMSEIIQNLGALVSVHHEVEVCGLKVNGPSLCHDIDHHGLEIVDKVSAGIVRVDDFVCLEVALIFISG